MQYWAGMQLQKRRFKQKIDPTVNDYGFRKKKDSMSAWISANFNGGVH